jgi:hypothetical protein
MAGWKDSRSIPSKGADRFGICVSPSEQAAKKVPHKAIVRRASNARLKRKRDSPPPKRSRSKSRPEYMKTASRSSSQILREG